MYIILSLLILAFALRLVDYTQLHFMFPIRSLDLKHPIGPRVFMLVRQSSKVFLLLPVS